MAIDDKFELGDNPMLYRNKMFDLLRSQCYNNGHRNAECYKETQKIKYMYCGQCYSAYEVKKK